MKHTVNKLLRRKSSSPLPSQVYLVLTASQSSSRTKYPNFSSLSHKQYFYFIPILTYPSTEPSNFSSFKPASESEILRFKFNCPNKQCDSDPIPIWLLKECASVLIPTITNIVNLSLTSGQFHPILKESVISPLLKKPTLDKD